MAREVLLRGMRHQFQGAQFRFEHREPWGHARRCSRVPADGARCAGSEAELMQVRVGDPRPPTSLAAAFAVGAILRERPGFPRSPWARRPWPDGPRRGSVRGPYVEADFVQARQGEPAELLRGGQDAVGVEPDVQAGAAGRAKRADVFETALKESRNGSPPLTLAHAEPEQPDRRPRNPRRAGKARCRTWAGRRCSEAWGQ